MPGVITSRAIARRASKLSSANPLQTMSRSVTMPISWSFSPIGMAPTSCLRINFASPLIVVSGPTHSTPLCIASLTFMANLRRWSLGALDDMQPPALDIDYTTDRALWHEASRPPWPGLVRLGHVGGPAIGWADQALSDRPSVGQLTTIEAHLRKALSIFGWRHAGMALEQAPEESDILIADPRADGLNGRGAVLQQFLGRRYPQHL